MVTLAIAVDRQVDILPYAIQELMGTCILAEYSYTCRDTKPANVWILAGA
jgi:hypothetical protein